MLNSATEKMVFDLVSGKKTQDALTHQLAIGRATCYPGESHYAIKIWMFYNQTFYLVRNHGDEVRYTIFAKKVQDDSGVKFLNPVGAGYVPQEFKTHLELKFRFPRQSLFMSLFPAQS